MKIEIEVFLEMSANIFQVVVIIIKFVTNVYTDTVMRQRMRLR
jgi:hypothetical protein